ncbi:hypothetical protein PO909_016880 [Leuciscus waleckii]
MRRSSETLDSDRLVPVRCKPGDFLECEGGVYGRLNLGMGSAARGQTVIRPVVGTGKASAYKLPGNDGSRQRAVCPQIKRHHVLADGTPPGLGSAQSALAQGSACARPSECGTRQTVQKQSADRRMVFTSTDSQNAMEEIWQSVNRPICVSRERSLSGILLQEQGCAGSRLAPLPALCVSPCHAPTPGVRANQGERMPSATCRPILDKPSLVSSPDAADEYRPVADTGEEGSPLAGERLDLASSPGALVPTCVGHQRSRNMSLLIDC